MSTSSFNPDQPGAPSRTALPFAQVSSESRLAVLAVRALLAEADLTPKPGLVDQRGSGAHADLSLERMHRSARALFPCFRALALASAASLPSQHLRERLAAIGRDGERAMFRATGGSNSHKGAIWALGLLVSGAVLASGCSDPRAIASLAGILACHPDSQSPSTLAHGAFMQQKYGVSGARGEAQQSFPHVLGTGLPALRQARSRGVPENHARLDALLAIMAQLDDTCLLHRGGLPALHAAKHGATLVLSEGGASTPRGMNRLLQLDAQLLTLNASPGGSADLLAATLFLDFIADDSGQQLPFEDGVHAELNPVT